MKIRYITQQVKKDLARKMVFLGGARQVGKTTLAKYLLSEQESGYLNWDVPEHRERILNRELPISNLWVFDEIHKYRQWRNYLKGIFDIKQKTQKILVTGSARLDLYRFAGDSLQGRYHYLRLHPLSLAELGNCTQDTLLQLLHLGGFPEPFFMGSEVEAKRWSREYRSRLLQEDLTQLEQVKDLGNIELLALRLPTLVGSPLSINSLREDLQMAHKTIANWLKIFERLYAIFRISPFGPVKLRAIRKEQKHYQFDWTLVSDLSKRFENLVACALLKWCNFLEDTTGTDVELRYFRDVDGREVDFVVIRDNVPSLFVECKWNDSDVSPALKYLKNKFPNCEAWQVSAIGTKDYMHSLGIRVSPAVHFLKGLI